MQNVILNARYKDYKSGRMLSLGEEEAADVISRGIGKYVDYRTSDTIDEEDTTLSTLEEFTELNATDQKEFLTNLQIDGDIGNEDKRVALYILPTCKSR